MSPDIPGNATASQSGGVAVSSINGGISVMAKKYTYFFGNGTAEGDGKQRELLGGKGANLHEMTTLGLPVPAGFTISTEVCVHYYGNGKKYPTELKEQMLTAL